MHTCIYIYIYIYLYVYMYRGRERERERERERVPRLVDTHDASEHHVCDDTPSI